MTEAEALVEVKQFIARGDLLRAFDHACSLVKVLPESEKLKQQALLALARSGAVDHAQRLFEEWGLGRSDDTDILALEGRLAKDRALRLTGEARRAAMSDAAAAYQTVNARKPSYYPAINAATTTLLSGDVETASDLARQVLTDPAIIAATDYWSMATRAEAACIIGDLDIAASDVRHAAALNADHSERATTRKQLRLILAETGIDGDRSVSLLAPLAAPLTVHFASASSRSGGWSASADAEREMRSAIEAVIAETKPASAFGSVGTPAEIIFAEAALDAGSDLEIVLPVRLPALKAAIAKEAGDAWANRLETCCTRAQRLVLTSDDPEAAEASHTDFAARVAMGLTLLRAQHLDGEAIQILLQDTNQLDAKSDAWAERPRRIVDLSGFVPSGPANDALDHRPTHALIFADILGFSALQERLLPVFWETVMTVIGAVAEQNKDVVFERNTWGDAVLLVCKDARSAARICIEVQRQLAKVDARRFGRDEPPAMRIGAHYGPVFTGWDPIVQKQTHYGRALSKAARIEPITPPGGVYVSEPFAAILLLETGGEYQCTYVGTVPLAKSYGDFRMYNLTLT
jgi:class 3 adenylate cyclase